MSYKKILVAISIYDDYDHVINSAVSFAKSNGASIEIITCIDNTSEFVPASIGLQSMIESDANTKINEIKTKVEKEYDISVTSRIIAGNPNRQITNYAQSNNHDLIIVGSHSRHGINLLLGSTTNSIVHRSTCDVLTIYIGDNKNILNLDYQKILVATDCENDSERVVTKTKLISEIYNSNIEAVHVHSDPAMITGIYGVFPDTQLLEIHKNAIGMMSKWLEENNLSAQSHVLDGNTSEQIVNMAINKKCDLIILGSHKRGAIGRFFLGSTANAVLHSAKCDILMIKI